MSIVKFTGITKAEVSVDKVLTGALGDGLDVVLVLGRDAEGELCAYSSVSDRDVNILMCEEFKYKLFSGQMGSKP